MSTDTSKLYCIYVNIRNDTCHCLLCVSDVYNLCYNIYIVKRQSVSQLVIEGIQRDAGECLTTLDAIPFRISSPNLHGFKLSIPLSISFHLS